MASLPIESNRARVVNAFREADKRSGIFIIRHLKILFEAVRTTLLTDVQFLKKKKEKAELQCAKIPTQVTEIML